MTPSLSLRSDHHFVADDVGLHVLGCRFDILEFLSLSPKAKLSHRPVLKLSGVLPLLLLSFSAFSLTWRLSECTPGSIYEGQSLSTFGFAWHLPAMPRFDFDSQPRLVLSPWWLWSIGVVRPQPIDARAMVRAKTEQLLWYFLLHVGYVCGNNRTTK